LIELELPVIDGLAVAVALIEMLSHCGIVTSKRGGYAAPLVKSYSGIFKLFCT
jgi:allantoin racemase